VSHSSPIHFRFPRRVRLRRDQSVPTSWYQREYWNRALLASLAAGAIFVPGLAGCGSSSFKDPYAATQTTPRLTPTPTLAQQVRRAERVGPGSLNYCPNHSGVASARYSVTVPGGGTAGGWCRTVAQRLSAVDRVTFWMHWDATKLGAGSGTEMLRYVIARPVSSRATRVSLRATPVPILQAQSGSPPP
jgi:hypothetical protein